MNTTRWIAPILALVLIASSASPPTSADVDLDVSFGFFHSNLSPHGSWFVSGSYGRVWQPAVYTADWNPYYDGHWVYSDCGWTWVSDYDWGAVPYHYGTWVRDPMLGWVWVPGYTWAPSWVVFRTGPDYIGWAPVAPTFSVGLSVGFSDYDYDPYDYDAGAFVFVGTRNFLAPSIRTYVVPTHRSRTVIQNTTIVNNIRVENNVVVNRGPDVRQVEQATGERVEPRPIERVAKVAPGGRVNRAALRVDTTKARTGLRVAEPVTGEQAAETERAQKGAPGPTSRQPGSSKATRDPKAAPQRTTPPSQPVERQPGVRPTDDAADAKAKAAAKTRADTQERADAKATANDKAKAVAKTRADTQKREEAGAAADAKAQADARNRAEAQARAEAKAAAQARAKAAKAKAKAPKGEKEAEAKKKKKEDEPS